MEKCSRSVVPFHRQPNTHLALDSVGFTHTQNSSSIGASIHLASPFSSANRHSQAKLPIAFLSNVMMVWFLRPISPGLYFLHCALVTLHMLFEWDALVLVWYKCTMVNQLKEFSNLRTKWRTQSEIFIIWLGFVFIALSILYRSYTDTLLPCPPRRPFFFTRSHLCDWKKHGQAIVYYRLMGHALLRLPEKKLNFDRSV